MTRSVLAAVALALVVSACATVNIFGDRAEQRLSEGLTALEQNDFETGTREVGWVALNYHREEIGRRALLVAAAAEIDPRNPKRRLAYGADLAATYLRQPEKTPDWLGPVAQALYLSALELGAAEERVAQAEQRAEEVERKLPELPSPSVTSRLREAVTERDRLSRRVEQLEKDLAERTKKLSDTEKELERIRKTLKS